MQIVQLTAQTSFNHDTFLDECGNIYTNVHHNRDTRSTNNIDCLCLWS